MTSHKANGVNGADTLNVVDLFSGVGRLLILLFYIMPQDFPKVAQSRSFKPSHRYDRIQLFHDDVNRLKSSSWQ